MKIGICEDDKNDADYIIELLNDIDGVTSVDYYADGEALIEAYENGNRYDLVFMDINLPGATGVETAKVIHNRYVSERPLILFLTVTDSYVYEAYNVGWDYLCKPIAVSRMQSVIDNVNFELSHRKLSLLTLQGAVLFETKDILYFESNRGIVEIATTDGVYASRQTLDAIQSLLGERPFYKTHRSYIVNLGHVARFRQNEVILSSGDEIPLSRNQKKAFLESFENFQRGARYG